MRDSLGKGTWSSCPCAKCCNVRGMVDPKTIFVHLVRYGFDESYTTWYFHGESFVNNVGNFEPFGSSSHNSPEDTHPQEINFVNEELRTVQLDDLDECVDKISSDEDFNADEISSDEISSDENVDVDCHNEQYKLKIGLMAELEEWHLPFRTNLCFSQVHLFVHCLENQLHHVFAHILFAITASLITRQPSGMCYKIVVHDRNFISNPVLRREVEDGEFHQDLMYLKSNWWVEENRFDKLNFARQKQACCYFSAAATFFSPQLSEAHMAWAKNGVLTTVFDDFII
ncbi:hypothetical protein IFM89_038118 [Coptis chinensis]|uniref:Transposase-associated domain-containing protein n=1 Tax=Coptis chinensis TaxID=261450 RepID=A0A835HN05_9MAGN|nr:hypothetical protein IFM89_038118 [Coptis chinensis]